MNTKQWAKVGDVVRATVGSMSIDRDNNYRHVEGTVTGKTRNGCFLVVDVNGEEILVDLGAEVVWTKLKGEEK